MRPFGTLKWSQWSQKICSEQLRSSSIDGSFQMVRTGTRKMQKRSVCFWSLALTYQRVIVDGWFFDVLASAEALTNQISLSKIHFRWNFDQKHFFWFWSAFCFSIFVFFSASIFDFSDTCEFRWKNIFLVIISIVFVQFSFQNPPRAPFIIY